MDTDLRFLEISLAAADVQASLEWYRALGFAELTTADIRHWHYAVVTDGDICLGLHGDGIDQGGLCFVRPDLANYVRSIEAQGLEFESVRLGVEDFHEALLCDPAGNTVLLLEARTFSPSADADSASIGQLERVSLPCVNRDESAAFWESLGFIGVESDEQDNVELHTPGLTLNLENGTRNLALHYQTENLGGTLDMLSRSGIESRKTPDGTELRAPEGTRILLSPAE